MSRIESLTHEQWAEVYRTRNEFLAIGRSTERLDRSRAKSSVKWAYALIGRPKPAIIWVDGPIAACVVSAMLRVDEQLGSQLGSQLRSQLWSQLRSQLWSQLRSQLWSQLRSQLGSQLGSQLWSQLEEQLWSQLRSQLGSQLWSQLGSQLWSQLGSQLDEQLRLQLWSQSWSQLDGFCGGLWWWTWGAHYAVAARLCGLVPAVDTSGLEAWGRDVHLCIPLEGVCIMIDRPTLLRLDGDGALHCVDGPAMAYADGTEVYAVQGVRVPREWIAEPGHLTPEIALTWANAEQRRAAATLLGWARILESVGATVVHKDADPEIGTLLRCDLPDSPGEQFLRVRCGTGRDFVLPVPPTVTTAREAQDWMWSLEPGEYRPEART